MADSESPHDIERQATTKTPPPARVKDPKKVAAGKALQQKRREAKEAQRKLVEAQQKELDEAKTRIEELESAEDEGPKITTTQWLRVISIVVSLVGLYYKREEIKSVFTRNTPPITPPPVPPNSPVCSAPPRKAYKRMS